MLSLPLLFRVFYSVFGVKRRVLRCAAVVTAAHLCRAHFHRSTHQKRPLKHQKPMFDVYKGIYCLSSDLAVDFLRFCRQQRRPAVYRPEGATQST